MCARDRGAAATELSVAVPCLLLMLMLVVQFTVYAHATHVAQAVAARARAAARVDGGTSADGSDVARDLLTQLDSGALAEPAVDVHRRAGDVDVTVTGVAASVVPGFHLTVSANARGPVERFVPAGA